MTAAETAIGASAALAIASGRSAIFTGGAIAGTMAMSSTSPMLDARTYVGSMLGLGVGAGAPDGVAVQREGSRGRVGDLGKLGPPAIVLGEWDEGERQHGRHGALSVLNAGKNTL